jgi:hypothetical protein
MDKIEYRAIIKLFVKEGLTPNEVNSKFIKVMVTLLRFQQLRNGLPSLNVAVPALKMIHVKDVQTVKVVKFRQLSRKISTLHLS